MNFGTHPTDQLGLEFVDSGHCSREARALASGKIEKWDEPRAFEARDLSRKRFRRAQYTSRYL
jgi:hypothetical protein